MHRLFEIGAAGVETGALAQQAFDQLEIDIACGEQAGKIILHRVV